MSTECPERQNREKRSGIKKKYQNLRFCKNVENLSALLSACNGMDLSRHKGKQSILSLNGKIARRVMEGVLRALKSDKFNESNDNSGECFSRRQSQRVNLWTLFCLNVNNK
jgi:hypothetical protein